MPDVRLDPYQNIVNVGWGGIFALITLVHDVGTPVFGLNLVHPQTDFDDDAGDADAGWPRPPSPQDFDHWLLKISAFDESTHAPKGYITFFVNVAKLFAHYRNELIDEGDAAIELLLGIGNASPSTPTPSGAGKIRSVVYIPSSLQILKNGFIPDISGATTFDAILDANLLPGGIILTKQVVNTIQPYIAELDIGIPELPPNGGGPNIILDLWRWMWDYKNRDNAAAYPPAGADPVLSPA